MGRVAQQIFRKLKAKQINFVFAFVQFDLFWIHFGTLLFLWDKLTAIILGEQ